ncbi:MAG: T9SS type A sorting domain-containing protein [Flavobacteriales bacterium]|nr:T9SS type A sorting domain-containing protein [Flavobacteriales bacterium]
MTKYRFLIPIVLFCVTAIKGQTTKNVLFLGNSYTSVNNLPSLTQNLATSLGDVLTVDSNTPGGYTFNGHSTNSTSLNKIAQGGWDYVVLQEQSQIPSFPPSQVATDSYPYSAILVDSILSANPCAVPLFYMTWGRENGDQSNCASYAPLCTYDGMQARLRESYLEMGVNNDAEVSPVGAAWKYVRDNYPTIDLYSSDGSHPSIQGSYLAACVHYASIYKKSPVGASFISTLSTADALILQTAAEMIVIDSMSNWNFGVRNVTADFSSNISGFDVAFNYLGSNGITFDWIFGDGNSSNDENPENTYLTNGSYSVELIATDGCTSDTSTAEVIISSTGLGVQEIDVISSVSKENDRYKIKFNQYVKGSYLLYNFSGKLVSNGDFSGEQLSISTPSVAGYYILTIRSGEQTQSIKLVR